MATSPRALIAGYPWLDTLSHELTHYVVNRASRNTVPIWLHEGIAKTEERRWREGFGGPLPAFQEHLLASALHDGHLIPFSAMHPSMAKLPSQEDAALAFAEVTTAIQYLTDGRGPAALRKLLGALRDGADLSRAIAGVTGQSFAAFERGWRSWLKGRGFRLHPELGMAKLRFKHDAKDRDDDDDPTAKEPHSPTEIRARGHVRIGTMLRTRGHLGAAAAEYQRAESLLGAGHPAVAAKLGRTLLELRQWDKAIAAARPGISRRPESAGLQVTVGRALLEKGEPASARPYLEGALAVNPYDPQTRCGLAQVYRATNDPRLARETNACAQLGGAP
jgi:tetratricopeptide (TPR) repeat protein